MKYLGPLASIEATKWREVVATNLDAPLFLTQALLPHLELCGPWRAEGARVLNMSSGTAHRACVGWGAYCVTKSGMHMMYRKMYRVLSAGLAPEGTSVGSVRPGVVATPIQDGIREYHGAPVDFPMKHKFDDLHSAWRNA